MRINRPNWVYAQADVTVRRPLEEVFDFVCDATNDPRWILKVISVQKLSADPVGVGTRFRQVASMLGGRVEAEWEVTAYEKSEYMSGRSIRSIVDFEGGYTFSGNDEVSRITKFGNFDLSNAPPIPTIMVSKLLEGEFRASFERLKRLLESKKG
jgi:uncharacterized membrane protein